MGKPKKTCNAQKTNKISPKKPITKKKTAGRERGDLRWALSSMQGWRSTMEDSHRVSLTLPGQLNDWAFAAVFDGHAGEQASAYASKNLLPTIVRKVTKSSKSATGNGETQNEQDENRRQRIKRSIKDGFMKLDDVMRKSKTVTDDSGTTAVCVFVTETHFYFANCGDSRAILCRENKVHFATTDHKPKSKEEKRRIESAGGFVLNDRVCGRLALSRALGDYSYKQNVNKCPCYQMVTPIPDVTIIERNNQSDEFIVLACDGVFDVMRNSELINYIKKEMTKTKNLKAVCNRVVDHCLAKGSSDNISIVILTLPACPTHEYLVEKKREDLRQMSHVIRSKNGNDVNGQTPKITSKSNTVPPSTTNNNLQGACASTNAQNRPSGILSQNGSGIPNPFLIYYMDYWRRKGGNICQAAKLCGQRWKRMTRPRKEKYVCRYRWRKWKLSKKNITSSAPSA